MVIIDPLETTVLCILPPTVGAAMSLPSSSTSVHCLPSTLPKVVRTNSTLTVVVHGAAMTAP